MPKTHQISQALPPRRSRKRLSRTAGALGFRSPPKLPGVRLSAPDALPAGGGAAAMAGPDLRYLVHHATMGFSVLEYVEAQNLGWNGYLEQQLAPENIDDSAVDAALAQFQTLDLTPSQLFTQYPDDQVEIIIVELQIAVLLRAIYSRRQLFERMVAFWTDHFNISQLDDLCLWLKTDDDREVVRKHALGTFPDMLKASARSPAMLWYLDNYANSVGAAQENYGRELLELHTLGVDGPYTEDDVKEVARCFTGWTLGGLGANGPVGEFVFEPSLHDTGQKTVLGRTIPAGGGIEDGELVLEILATHPKTAEFIAFKLCRWLLGYEPPTALVRAIATIYLQTGGDIKQMVRGILDPAVVARIPLAERTKLRQPLHFLISLARATLISSTNLLEFTYSAQALGQVPFWWPSPDGPPDSLERWGSALLPRWEFASRLFGGQLPGNQPDLSILDLLLQSAPSGGVAEQIDWVLSGGLLPADERAEVQAYIDAQPSLTPVVLLEAFALAASSPGYQFF